MYSMVKVLRKNGLRKSDREIHSDPFFLGHITLVNVQGVYELVLYAPGDDSRRNPMIPTLYNARVVTMHGDSMLWEGDEREGTDWKARTVKQEWSVRLAVDPPKEVPQQSKRLG